MIFRYFRSLLQLPKRVHPILAAFGNVTVCVLSYLYVCMAIKYIIVLFVETPQTKLNKFTVINNSNKFTWCFHKQNYYVCVFL